jgi:hypothetical protein
MDYSYVTPEYAVKQFEVINAKLKVLETENKNLKGNIAELKNKLSEQKILNEFHEYRLSTNEKNFSDLNNNLMNYLAYGKPLPNIKPSSIPSNKIIENFVVPKQVFTEVNPIQPIQPSIGLFKPEDKNPFSFKTF